LVYSVHSKIAFLNAFIHKSWIPLNSGIHFFKSFSFISTLWYKSKDFM
jgi:hypothetical protein